MVKMIHITAAENAASILEDGLVATETVAISHDEQHEGCGVWLFADEAEARNFTLDNYAGAEVATLLVETDGLELISDPEYDKGVSFIALEDIGPERISVL
jgi:hypothetical protein